MQNAAGTFSGSSFKPKLNNRPAMTGWSFVFPFIILLATSQASTAQLSDPRALSLAWQAISAQVGRQVINDATLSGNVTYGSDESIDGTVTLTALGAGESRMELSLPDGTRTEIRDASLGLPQGKWIDQKGDSGMYAAQNTFTDPVWFFPTLGSLAGGSNVVLSYVGDETFKDHAVHHLRSYMLGNWWPPTASPGLQELSTVDFYLDAVTSLPVATVFNEHPDNDARVNLVVEIDFSDYRMLSGVEVPMRIERSVNGSPILQIAITNAQFNTGLASSEFSVN